MKKYFFTGLVTLLPLAVTLWFIHFVVNFLTKPFIGIFTLIIDHFIPAFYLRIISQIAILISLFLFTLLLGFLARRFFFRGAIHLGDQILHRIPLVGKVYKTSKDIVISLFGSRNGSFKQTVMVPFPYKGCFCIGLVAREAPKTCSQAEHDQMVSVFIPTTPNPTTGFLTLCHKSELIYLDMKSDEALKYIISCAVIQPQRNP